LTKPQGAIVLPVVLLAAWNAGGGSPADRLRRAASAVAGGLAVSAVLLAPIVAAGTWPNMVRMLRTLADDESLSMSAYNVWWLAGPEVTVGHAGHWRLSL